MHKDWRKLRPLTDLEQLFTQWPGYLPTGRPADRRAPSRGHRALRFARVPEAQDQSP